MSIPMRRLQELLCKWVLQIQPTRFRCSPAWIGAIVELKHPTVDTKLKSFLKGWITRKKLLSQKLH
jgi:hypothetical protein